MGALNPDSKLCVLHCSKAYSGQPILQDISFAVRDGEFLSILGPLRLRKDHAAANFDRSRLP